MKKILLKILFIATGVFIFLYTATWIYYRQTKLPKEVFTPSIIPVKRSMPLQWIPIHWVKNEFSDRSAMYLPVYIDTISKPFWMQFDLGTAVTDLNNISNAFPFLKQKEKIIHQVNGEKIYEYENISLRLGDSLLYHGNNIPLTGQPIEKLNESDSLYENKAGDLGYDLIKDRILIIDYKHSRIAITDSLDEDHLNNSKWFIDVLINQKPMFLSISIDGRKKYMAFDNGSSAFTFWTSMEQWNNWRDEHAPVDTFTGFSWGKKEYYFRSASSVNIHFLNRNMDSLPIWAVDKGEITRKKSFFGRIKKFTDKYFGKVFNGWIGNEYFRDEVVIFDTRHNRLAIYTKQNE